MEKLQSSFKNMVLSLVIICVVAAGALAGVYILTLETINAQKAAKQQAAILSVLPEGVTIAKPQIIDGLTVYNATLNGEYAGAAVETQADGFGGPQKIMVGFDAEGRVINYEVLEHQETPGLGDHIVDWFKNAGKPSQNILGRKADGKFLVTKDGGDIDAITAATISSRAFLKAINLASAALHDDVEAHTGASQIHHEPGVVHIHGERVEDNEDPEAVLEAEQLQDAQEMEQIMETEVDHE